jgi:uncharacterized protein YdcH (DUF465 family)
MVSYSLVEEFPDLTDRFTHLSYIDPEFAAQLASYYAVDAQIMALSSDIAFNVLPDLTTQRLRLKESLYRQLLSK